jgi:hypothetical protein
MKSLTQLQKEEPATKNSWKLIQDIRSFIIDETKFNVNNGTCWDKAAELLIFNDNCNIRIFVSCYESNENKMMFSFTNAGTDFSFTLKFKTLNSFKIQYKKLIGKYKKVRLEYINKEIEMLNKLFTKGN